MDGGRVLPFFRTRALVRLSDGNIEVTELPTDLHWLILLRLAYAGLQLIRLAAQTP